MALREQLYTQDVTTVKRYGSRYKLTYSRFCRNSGVECPPRARRAASDDNDLCDAENDLPPSRLDCNLSRARSTVFELAMCNPWEYFCTFTLDDSKGFDRFDLGAWHKDFAQWLRNLRRNHGGKFAYLIVPENHKDGAWHMHALMSGIPEKLLRRFELSERLPYKLRDKIASGDVVYDWTGYRNKYGYVSIEAVKDHDRCAGYLTKYITKALSESSLMACEHLFFSSQKLLRAEVIAKGYMHHSSDYDWDYKNDYVSVKWADENIWATCEIAPRSKKPSKSLAAVRVECAEKAYVLNEQDGKKLPDNPVFFPPFEAIVVDGNPFTSGDIFKSGGEKTKALWTNLSLFSAPSCQFLDLASCSRTGSNGGFVPQEKRELTFCGK